VELVPGSAQAIRRLREAGLGTVVVTNQSVVGRGMLGEAGLQAVHDRMRSLLGTQGAGVDAIYHCPHLPEAGCACRKPKTELVERAARDLGFDPSRAFLIGDHTSDMELGRRVGATTILVLTGHGRSERERASALADHVVRDLAEAAEVVLELVSV
jgi:D-glycero-D-manno-heptose 1,7-bisphosphate phosphatase